MSETTDKAWINLWLPELNEAQVSLLIAKFESEITMSNIEVVDDVLEMLQPLKDKGVNDE